MLKTYSQYSSCSYLVCGDGTMPFYESIYEGIRQDTPKDEWADWNMEGWYHVYDVLQGTKCGESSVNKYNI